MLASTRDGNENGDPEQNRLGRQRRIDVGIGRAGDPAAVGVHEAIPVQPVGERLEHDEEEDQDRDVPAGGQGDLRPRGLEPDRSVQVVHSDREHEREEHRAEAEPEQQPVDRVVPGEERNIAAELRILDAETAAEAPQHPGSPVTLRGQAGTQERDDHNQDEHEPLSRLESNAVTLEVLLLGGQRTERRSQQVGHDHVAADHQGHQQAEDDEQHGSGADDRRENAAETNLAEPQPVDVDADERVADDQHQDEDADD